MRPTSVESASSAPSNSYSGIDHLDAPGPVRIEFRFSVQDHALPGLQLGFEIIPMKKFAGERAGVVADQQVIHAAAGARIADQAAARDLRLQRVDLPGRNVANFREVDAVLIAEREIAEKVVKGAQAALGQQLGAVRPDAFQVHQFGCGHDLHLLDGLRVKAVPILYIP